LAVVFLLSCDKDEKKNYVRCGWLRIEMDLGQLLRGRNFMPKKEAGTKVLAVKKGGSGRSEIAEIYFFTICSWMKKGARFYRSRDQQPAIPNF